MISLEIQEIHWHAMLYDSLASLNRNIHLHSWHTEVRKRLFVGGFMSYLRYLCLLAYSGYNTYCIVFLLCMSSSCVWCTLCCQFLWIVHLWLPFGFLSRLFNVWLELIFCTRYSPMIVHLYSESLSIIYILIVNSRVFNSEVVRNKSIKYSILFNM